MISASETLASPSRTMPSAAIRSPGRTRIRSPGLKASTATRSSPASVRRLASEGSRAARAARASVVRARAEASRYRPIVTKRRIPIAVSRYIGPCPESTERSERVYAAATPMTIRASVSSTRPRRRRNPRTRKGAPRRTIAGVASARSAHRTQTSPTARSASLPCVYSTKLHIMTFIARKAPIPTDMRSPVACPCPLCPPLSRCASAHPPQQ